MPFIVLVYGPVGGWCNYTPVAPLSTSGEVCGTADRKPEWHQYCSESFPRASRAPRSPHVRIPPTADCASRSRRKRSRREREHERAGYQECGEYPDSRVDIYGGYG